MKTITVLETADEVLDAFSRVRPPGDEYLFLPQSVGLVIPNDYRGPLTLEGQGSEEYRILEGVRWEDILAEMVTRTNLRYRRRTATEEETTGMP